MDATVGELGEFGLIDAITARLHAAPARAARARATTPLWSPRRTGGWSPRPTCSSTAGTSAATGPSARRRGARAAAANLADIAAMGAVPTALLVGLALPAGPADRTGRLELADGLRDECGSAGAAVVGGDVVRSDAWSSSVTALGSLEGRDAGDPRRCPAG